jgi:hypothetical protein
VPPAVLAIEPPDGATRVSPGTPVQIVFSERMDKESVERAIRVAPDPGRFERAWSATSLTLSIPAGTPVGAAGERIVTVLRTAEDRRGNRLAAPFDAAFTVGDSIPPGEIAGKLTGDSRGQARILVFTSPGPPLDSLAAVPPLRETSAGASGAFVIRHVPVGGPPFALFALSQGEHRQQIDPARDRIAVGPDSIHLSTESPRAGEIAMALVKPDAPGSVSGRLTPPRADAAVRLVSADDTTKTVEATTDSLGSFLLEPVPPGRYRIRVSEGGDGAAAETPFPGVAEPLAVAPGERVSLSPPDSAAAPAPDSAAVRDTPEQEPDNR